MGSSPFAPLRRRLKKLSAERGYELIPGHDPHVWPEMTEKFRARFPAPESV